MTSIVDGTRRSSSTSTVTRQPPSPPSPLVRSKPVTFSTSSPVSSLTSSRASRMASLARISGLPGQHGLDDLGFHLGGLLLGHFTRRAQHVELGQAPLGGVGLLELALGLLGEHLADPGYPSHRCEG